MKRLLPLALLAAACGPSEKNPAPPAMPGDEAVAAAEVPAEPVLSETTLAAVGLDPAALDRSADPCDDFYQFACGGWLEATEIPADRARYGRFTEIYERNEAQLRDILEAAREAEDGDPVHAKIGAFYGACMDEAAAEKAGLTAIEPLLARARSVKKAADLGPALRTLHASGIPALFALEPSPDFADATRVIAFLEQGGLGLPDRNYYTDDSEKFASLRATYREHVATMLALAGQSKQAARRGAREVLAIETALAKVSMSRADRRNPEKVYNPVDRAMLASTVQSIDWDAYFAALGRPDVAELSLEAPGFFAALDSIVRAHPPRAWRSYLAWHVLREMAPSLPKRFVDEDFRMTAALTGATEISPRFRRCIQATDVALGELLAQPYLERSFTPEAKAAADALVAGITDAFGEVLTETEWMSEATRVKARVKLEKMVYLIGYPDAWKQYDFDVSPTDHAANVLAAAHWRVREDLAKVGKPYDRSEWYMTPQTVNAYYNPLANQMVFPAGILQPPFFSAEAHAPVNFGAIGMVMGHELTHGFDDSGAKFDADGNMADWWQEDDLSEFQGRGQCVVAQYGGYQPVEGVNLDGELTLGENIADLGGIKLAFRAYRKARAGAASRTVADGFGEDQQFFLATAQAWCNEQRDEEARRLAVTDPHAPPRFRVLGSLRNLPEFAEAFDCPAGSAMRPADTCEVW